MKQKLISVIIPCYNHAQYVERSILSVLNQSYRPIELIVIDDGSSDASISVVEKLADKYDFMFIKQKNQGVCKTLNRGIQEFSKGDYIALLASDDYWHSDKIQEQISALSQNPDSEFCFTQAFEFEDSAPDKPLRIFPSKPLTGKVLNQVFLRQHVPAGSMLFTRKLYDRLGGFDENLLEEDWDFVIRAASETSFCAVSKPLFFYRSHAANIMKIRSRRNIFQQKAVLLSKNYGLVSPLLWFFSISSHFIYDHFIYKIKGFIK
ncbi:MAG: glycosyltransferase [Tenuifilaceae bacterium]|nr:glycosyltransferase [Tenuifilaceae bacterium]